MIANSEIKSIIKEEILKILKEEDNSLESLVYDILDAQSQGNNKKADEYYGLMFPRLSSMGFDRGKMAQMKAELTNLTNDKEATRFVAHWKIGDELIDADKIYVYKIIVGIPFATSKNKDEKIKQLKYDLIINGVKVLGMKEMAVSEVADAGAAGKVLKLKVMFKIKTSKKHGELENTLVPDYNLEKIKDISDELEKNGRNNS
tara:strand:+ start:2986 stop:3594 length:609 start_codon:yes stop_codon:yes gene_type:complete